MGYSLRQKIENDLKKINGAAEESEVRTLLGQAYAWLLVDPSRRVCDWWGR